MLTKYELAYIEWEDHHADGAWSYEDDVSVEATICASVGWVFRETDELVVLIGSHSIDTRQVGNKQTINKKLIKARRVLRKAARARS